MNRTVLIGGASGFWGDSQIAVPQLLRQPGLQYLVFDYLAETTMSILQRARLRAPELGYATDFVTAAVGPHLREIKARGVRLVSNAGGLNPAGCRDAILALAREQGVDLKVAIVTGDDVLDLQPRFEPWGDEAGAQLPALMSANAYLGAAPVAQALASGADIVVTGRCVDSASLLGIAIHEFGWGMTDYDRLAQASLAGHLVECGAQATGGLFTDWQQVPGWADMGYPVIDCAADGSFVLSKPEGTGGLIHPGAVAEQVLYEVGDPANYLMPDVTCDFRQVRVEALDAGHVRVAGARGRPPTGSYKANGTWRDGYQLQLMMAIRGIDAPAKARKTADALLARTRALMRERGFPDYTETCVELLGCEALYGPNARALPTREVVLRIGARHADPKALAFLQRECASAGTSMGPGTRSSFAGRADVQPVIKVFSFLVSKDKVALQVGLGDVAEPVPSLPLPLGEGGGEGCAAPSSLPPAPHPDPLPQGEGGESACVPLVALAWARSGDKGDDENVGVIARRPEFLPLLRAQLTPERVKDWFAHLVQGDVERFDVPGLHALNFVLHQALAGGGVASLRSDPLGKSFAQMLLDLPVRVPRRWADDGLLAPHSPISSL